MVNAKNILKKVTEKKPEVEQGQTIIYQQPVKKGTRVEMRQPVKKGGKK